MSKQALTEARDELVNLTNIVQDVLDGSLTQTELAKRLGISVMSAHRHLKSGFLPRLHKLRAFRPDELRELLLKTRTPYERLVYDVFRIPKDEPRIFIISEKCQKIMEDVINNHLTPFQKTVIESYYGIPDNTPMILDEIAEQTGRDRSWVHHSRDYALQKFRRPEVWNPLLEAYGLKADIETQIRQLYERNLTLANEYRELLSEYDSMLSHNGNLTKENPTLSEIKNMLSLYDNTVDRLITDIPMSVRLKHVLLRNGMQTVRDIIQYTEKDLLKFRNMGVGTLDELKTILNDMGLKLKNDTYKLLY